MDGKFWYHYSVLLLELQYSCLFKIFLHIEGDQERISCQIEGIFNVKTAHGIIFCLSCQHVGIKIIDHFLDEAFFFIVGEQEVAVVAVETDQIFFRLHENGFVVLNGRTPGNAWDCETVYLCNLFRIGNVKHGQL